ncbi:unnamed protein product (macronuclear) [Paramecium tetraurelia]|uniref:RING-type domain-containing protein n=1 Tax=Paramecium tetraurelia TaxID=5888 RepID=A0CTD1_PARTE|nr:uncharacterized protein GSPATT00010282001 [Paramecium tetraurelia]CAK74048.1 unnamed protein product [Paramecium tetraurelia]|eukprot:XP_001441445.1 hypothetical protein (macronuclear) [Paramecium tetraurelia strain d4-2]
MQSENQDYVRCKYCKQKIHQCQMFAHKLECNLQNHPNYQSEIKSRISENQSQFQSQNNPQQQSRVQQSSSRNPVQYVESHIYSSEQDNTFNQNSMMNNRRRSDYPDQQINASEAQRMRQQNRNQYTESLLKQAQKKCEYCDQEYPIQILEEHYPHCEAKMVIEQMSIEGERNENFYEQQNNNPYDNTYHLNQQQINNQNDIYSDQPQNRNQNIVTGTQIVVLPNGTRRKIITTTNLDTGQVIEKKIIIESQSQSQSQTQQFLQMPSFPITFGRNTNQQNQYFSFLNEFLRNPFMMNQRRSRFSLIPMMTTQHHRHNQGLDNLAIIKFVPYDGLSQEYKQCSICINNYEDGEELILLPCIHRFHKKCISEWFKNQSTCPICKTDITQQEMGYEEVD